MLSIVIPALNAGAGLATLLPHLVTPPPPSDATDKIVPDAREVIVVDGGSTDATARIAKANGARVIEAEKGRGTQLAAGAKAARGAWLFFLHADSTPGPGWREAASRFMADPANQYRAAYFQFQLDDEDEAARRVERLANWRARSLGLPYGDQGLIISRTFYDYLGGYPAMPLMEDVALVRRISKHRLEAFDCPMKTSAERYRRDGYWKRPVKNVTCLCLFYLGVPPHLIKRLYG